MVRQFFSVVVIGCSLLPAATTAAELDSWIEENLASIVALYTELHQAPELSFEEKQTSARLAGQLRAADCEVTQLVGGYGVVGILKNGAGPTVMLRTDMDALPVTEQTGLAYASQVRTTNRRGATVGVMHACGHDVHMANLAGVLRFLTTHRSRWSGTAMFVCQPAEEGGAGAKAMLDDGLFRRFPRPDFAIALHVSPVLPAGKVGYRAGYAMANVDSVDITINGRGGHGAYPHATIDPIVIAAHLILDLQTIVSREVKPIEPAVVTVGAIRGGTRHNIIGDTCSLQLTVRSYSPQVRRQLLDAIHRKAAAAAHSAAAPEPTVEVSQGTPALRNDDELVARIVPVFRRVLGAENVIEVEPTMGGEDFSRYGLAGVPLLMFSLGAVRQERLDAYTTAGGKPPSLHSPLFYPDPDITLRTAVTAMASAAMELMPPRDTTQQ